MSKEKKSSSLSSEKGCSLEGISEESPLSSSIESESSNSSSSSSSGSSRCPGGKGC